MSMSHGSDTSRLNKRLKGGLILNSIFMVFELAVGIFSGSLALISDAGHNLTDSLSLLIAFLANKIAGREANIEHSYGFGRATILAAFVNGLILILLSLFIFYEALQRIMHPAPVAGGIIASVAFVGILVNGSIAFIFKNETKDLNIKGAYINMFYDMLASVGALVAGLLILLTGLTVFDPLIGILIGVMLLKSSWGVIQDAMHVLLEGIPEGLNGEKIREAICRIPKIKAVDDLHIWAISSQYSALSCHVVIEDCDMVESTKIVKKIKEELNMLEVS